MTLEEKLESFKRDRVGFHVSSREVAELLGETLGRIWIHSNNGSTAHDAVMLAWEDHGEDAWVSVNFPYVRGTFCDRRDDIRSRGHKRQVALPRGHGHARLQRRNDILRLDYRRGNECSVKRPEAL